MKKSTAAFIALLLSSATGYSQGFYFKAGLGYAFPMAGQTIDADGAPYSGTRTNSSFLCSYALKSTSFSSGMQGGIGIGYMFSQHVGVQLDVNACITGKEYTFKDNNVPVNLGQGTIISNITVSQQADMPVMLAPSLVMQTAGRGKANLYTRVGPVFPLVSRIIQTTFVENVPGTGVQSSNEFTFVLKNRLGVGFTAGAGLQYKLSSKMSFWAEVSVLSMSLYMKQSDLTDFKHDGRSYDLSNVTSPHTYYYDKNVNVDTNGVNLPTYSHPFSNVGVNLGIRITMGKPSRRGSAGSSSDAADRREQSTRPKSGKFR